MIARGLLLAGIEPATLQLPVLRFEAIVHPKLQILPSFIDPCVAPNPYKHISVVPFKTFCLHEFFFPLTTVVFGLLAVGFITSKSCFKKLNGLH